MLDLILVFITSSLLNLSPQKYREFNAHMKYLANKNPEVLFVDIFSHFLSSDDTLLQDDCIHPTKHGIIELAKCLRVSYNSCAQQNGSYQNGQTKVVSNKDAFLNNVQKQVISNKYSKSNSGSYTKPKLNSNSPTLNSLQPYHHNPSSVFFVFL